VTSKRQVARWQFWRNDSQPRRSTTEYRRIGLAERRCVVGRHLVSTTDPDRISTIGDEIGVAARDETLLDEVSRAARDNARLARIVTEHVRDVIKT